MLTNFVGQKFRGDGLSLLYNISGFISLRVSGDRFLEALLLACPVSGLDMPSPDTMVGLK